jgi:hypothetical protein
MMSVIFADCLVIFIIMLSVFALTIVMLNVIIMSVSAVTIIMLSVFVLTKYLRYWKNHLSFDDGEIFADVI